MNLLVKNQTILDQSSVNNVFPQIALSKNIKLKLTKKKVLKIVLPIFLAAGCVLQQNNVTLLINRTCLAFRGHEGWAMPTLMISAYLALKYIIFLNQKSDDQEISITSRVFSWLKKVPTNFAIGVNSLLGSLILKISIVTLTYLMFESLSINTENTLDLKKISMFDMAVKGPFLEELFFREFVQGSLISTMKLINLVSFRMGKGITIMDETINTSSRIFSAAVFGLAHANQGLIQATAAGINSYFYENWLYEKNGLFASFGLHFANNFLLGYLIKNITESK